ETGGYTIEGVKGLFQSRAYPWRHRRAGESLVRWGIEHHCAGRYRSAGRLRDPWFERLRLVGEGEGNAAADARSLQGFYEAFSRDTAALVGARSFSSLRNQLQRFIKSWLDTEQWKPESRRIFQFALNALNDLIEAHSRIDGISVANPYSLWLALLGERLYVQRSGSTGIPVYPYRVSAGIGPAHHFILGATQLGTQVDWRPLSFLREDERGSLGVKDASATEEFLGLYLSSGTHVVLSFSDQDVAGIELPPGYFVMRGAVERPAGLEAGRIADPYLRERDIWTGDAAAPERVYALQGAGAAYFARVGCGRRGADITRSPIEEAAITQRITARLSDDRGRLKISPTHLDRFWECPFGFLFSTALRVEERSYSIEWSDLRTTGSLMHEVLRRLFFRIREGGGRFDPLRLEDYHRMIVDELGAALDEHDALGESFIPPVWNSLRRHLLDRLSGFLEAEAKLFGGLSVEGLESAYTDERATVLLEGRIDRISGDGSGVVVVDYKRTDRVKRRNLAARGEEGEPSEAQGRGRPDTFQIPFYVLLLKANGIEVRTAAYYAIEKVKYDLVFDESERRAWLSRPELDALLSTTEGAVREMELRVRSGAWMVPDLRTGCEECRLRSACRMKYSVR
ncbi:MAG TPA: PD-(D/E)XK nuclease family protein, partial [Spirochaetia bacterium]|nr:PD-(D/E)XK nuclease family protein [Spirochaetia bacterium]